MAGVVGEVEEVIGVSAVSLISKEIDEYQTIEKTKRFLTRDFDRYLNFSGRHRLDLSSPLLDPTGVSSHGGHNHTEDKWDNGVAAGYAVDAINDTIIDCTNTADAPFATILYLKYVKRLKGFQIQAKIGYSERQYYRFWKRALLEFAQRIGHWAERDHADIPDLVVWKEAEQQS